MRAGGAPSALDSLFDQPAGSDLPLPPRLQALYGSLHMPAGESKPHVLGNFVSSLDGVVALSLSDQTGGGEISGFNAQDQMVMGLLRSVADAIVVGAGTLRASPRHVWTAATMCKPLASDFAELRSSLGKAPEPLNVFVTASGALDLSLPVLESGEVPVLIVTTRAGAKVLNDKQPPAHIRIAEAGDATRISATSVLEAIKTVQPAGLVLTEGGPRLMAEFLRDRCLHELFLTLAPQVAGRAEQDQRPGFAWGRQFLPDDPRWARLVSLKRGGDHLFLRYAFS